VILHIGVQDQVYLGRMSIEARARRKDATVNREALLDAARWTLAADPSASLEAIAAAAGLSRRSVYGHFPSRDALLAELLERGAARVASAVNAVEHTEPLVEVALLGRVVWDEVDEVRTTTLFAVRGPFRALLAPVLDLLHQRITDATARAARAGDARTDLPPATVARLVEGAAFTVLDEATRSRLSRSDGVRLVVLAGLGALGLGWREADAFLAAHAAELGLEEQA
jgi:AcrR family transcriptional regulator